MKQKIISYLKKVAGRINPLSFAALTGFILISLTVASAITPLDGEDELYRGIIRFHVLANSDSKEDQDLKLMVRDRVTEYTTDILSQCTDIAQAKSIILQKRENILSIARDVISENGYEYDVTLETGMENYPRRIYGKYTFPAGNYYSVRINIGKAEGKNWWCVLFPPMCLGSATVEKYDDTAELSKIGFSDEEIEVISEPDNVKTEVRFFFLDLINKRK
ncbi:MAG: stage II sporulation protein R [Clostridia bacterium]|nr:stage II sporulation protein R [Clostridia bacterium]